MNEEERFQHAVNVVLRHEGGYVNDPNDPGGETKFGISRRAYPDLDIARLTKEDAIKIYRRDWWEKYRYGRIEDANVACKVMDLSVNVGPQTAHRLLQQALHACGHRHVVVDGLIGPQTLGAVNETEPSLMLVALRAEAAAYYRELIAARPALARYRNGWMNRAYA